MITYAASRKRLRALVAGNVTARLSGFLQTAEAAAMAIALALILFLHGCGDDCGGYSSFTDENGLIVFVACDGTFFVATPTPGRQ